jgi:Na+-driven multidrug efflux pump
VFEDELALHADRPGLLRPVSQLGIPTAIGMIVMSHAELVPLNLVNSFVSNDTAPYGAVNQIIRYVQIPRAFGIAAESLINSQSDPGSWACGLKSGKRSCDVGLAGAPDT